MIILYILCIIIQSGDRKTGYRLPAKITSLGEIFALFAKKNEKN